MKLFFEERDNDFVDLRAFLCRYGDFLDEYVQHNNTHLKQNAYLKWAKAIQSIIEKYKL